MRPMMDEKAARTLDTEETKGVESGNLLEKYRRCRDLSLDIHAAALDNLSQQAFLDHARRLGLGDGRQLLVDRASELTLVLDLAVYTAKEGRTRAIDRCARVGSKTATQDEALVLAGLCAARFPCFARSP